MKNTSMKRIRTFLTALLLAPLLASSDEDSKRAPEL